MFDQLCQVVGRQFRKRPRQQLHHLGGSNLTPLKGQDEGLLRDDVPGLCGRNGRFHPGLRPLLGHAERKQEGVFVRRQEQAVPTATTTIDMPMETDIEASSKCGTRAHSSRVTPTCRKPRGAVATRGRNPGRRHD